MLHLHGVRAAAHGSRAARQPRRERLPVFRLLVRFIFFFSLYLFLLSFGSSFWSFLRVVNECSVPAGKVDSASRFGRKIATLADIRFCANQ